MTLCDPGFWKFPTRERRAAVVLHEMTHAYAELPPDYFYYAKDFDFKFGWSWGTATRVQNADTYEMFYLRFALVKKACPSPTRNFMDA
jgi:hypothetical protein